jgi:hypothetical protein
MSAIAVNKSLLKEYQTSYGRTVYLDKDSEFQIKLFNPTTETVAAEVFVNGKSFGEKIIIRPGQLIWLERYLDEAKKFKFDTYEVDANVEEVKQAIRNNGGIKVKFYKEKQKHYQNSWHDLLGPGPYNWGGKVEINSAPNWNNTDIRCSTNDLTGTTLTSNIATMDSYSCKYSTIYNPVGDVNTAVYNINGTIDTTATSYSSTPNSRGISQPTETGRVEKGGYSNQRFTTIDLDIESWPFATEEIKLLPKSQKPVYKEDLEKIYCPECGRKVKTKFKYCPFCGEKL